MKPKPKPTECLHCAVWEAIRDFQGVDEYPDMDLSWAGEALIACLGDIAASAPDPQTRADYLKSVQAHIRERMARALEREGLEQ